MTYLTMLAEMMDHDLDAAAAQLRDLNIVHLDLKNHVFGRAIDDVDDERRERLAALVQRTGTRVYCFSSTLGHRNVNQVAEQEFRRSLTAGIANMVKTAAAVRPAKIRLLACNIRSAR